MLLQALRDPGDQLMSLDIEAIDIDGVAEVRIHQPRPGLAKGILACRLVRA
jgi:hypothetical protein